MIQVAPLRVLMLEDTAEDAELIETALREAGIALIAWRTQSREGFVEALREFRPDIVLSDYRLPTFDGRSALQVVQEQSPATPVIMVTGAIGDERAVDLLKSGARDYVLKDRLVRLPSAVRRVLQEDQESRRRRHAEQALRESEAKFREELEGLVERRTEDLRRAKEEAELANRAKSEFLSRMSHELRTPMNAILGFAQVLELEALTTPQHDAVQEIQRAGDHLLELISDLLDLSRIESGHLAVTMLPVELRAVVADALQIVQPVLRRNEIQLINECTGAAVLLADRTRLRQVLVNLLSNAAKYNVTGGQIAVRPHALPDDRLRVDIADTGLGIPADKLSFLFKPFERLGAQTRGIEGTGIGLALTKQLIELMGGRIGVDSTPGQGSTFWIELGLITPQAGDANAPTPAKPSVNEAPALRLLYIEDNVINAKVMRALLATQVQLQLFVATNGEQGLELARRIRPDVILLDIHLPGMDGYAVLKALRSTAETAAIPVVALSADAMPGDISRAMAAGFAEYLVKPFRIAALNAAIATATRTSG